MKILDTVKDGHEEKVRANEIELENATITVDEADGCTKMVTKEEHNKEIERENMEIELT